MDDDKGERGDEKREREERVKKMQVVVVENFEFIISMTWKSIKENQADPH